MNKEITPTVREIKLYCVSCKKEERFFMTNKEISDKTKIMAYCSICQKTTDKIHKLRGKVNDRRMV